MCNFFTQQLVGSYVSQCCVNFLNSGLTVYTNDVGLYNYTSLNSCISEKRLVWLNYKWYSDMHFTNKKTFLHIVYFQAYTWWFQYQWTQKHTPHPPPPPTHTQYLHNQGEVMRRNECHILWAALIFRPISSFSHLAYEINLPC